MRLPRTITIGRNGESQFVGVVERQTQWIQNPPSNREGSSPSSGTIYARVVELADTLDLGSSISDVQVRVLSRAPLRSGSSWSARQPHKLEVVGSSPTSATKCHYGGTGRHKELKIPRFIRPSSSLGSGTIISGCSSVW